MEFRILGPLEVRDGPKVVRLGGRQQRALLALLLLHANQVVSSDRLIEEIWGGQAPETASAALRVHVAQLRKALAAFGGDVLVTRAPGYLLRVGPDELDLDRFRQFIEKAGEDAAGGEWAAAAERLRAALGLWRGLPLADVADGIFVQADISRIEELRLVALEQRIDADLALGRQAELVGELEALVGAHPFRERFRAQLMLALYRSGRQAEALALYQATRRLLVEELGIEPSPALRELEAAILRQDAELEPPVPPAIAADAPPEPLPTTEPESPSRPRRTRKTVTVLVSGLGEPARARGLDPELRRRLADRSFETVAPVLERHGGAVERLADGRVMGVFGVPAAHEDDALRALRAAVELREALIAGETIRSGIDTGEVLTGDPASGEPLVTGNPIDAAALLQQASAPGVVLIGETTRRLVRDAVRVEPLELPASDGAAEALSVWSLAELVPEAPPFERRFGTPLVGRDDELAQLRQAFERVARERRVHLFTVFGAAGIGKTRLAQELARSVEGEATVLTGCCLSYGEGITYWPLREIVAQATAGQGVRELLEGSPEGEIVAARLESAIGTGTAGAVKEEVFWAVRKLVEALARKKPLLLAFEDVHWGEPTLLDLIEHLADWVRDVPVLVVCLTRPELLDDRPGWGGGKLNATSILLDPLSDEESALLIAALSAAVELAPEARARIADAAEGNPLFLEQMLAMLAQEKDGADEIAVPPAIQALLAARLDRLEPEERRVLEHASIEGEMFHVGGVVELARPQAREAVASRLMSLARKELIRAESPVLLGEEAFRFRHALIRDAAYEGLPKETRSELHEHHATWLEEALGDRVSEAEEFLGYHLEQAYRYRSELGLVDKEALELADRARVRLASAGRLALRRGDTRAAVNLLERARALPAADERVRLEPAPDLGFALLQAGEFERAEAILSDAIERAKVLGERQTERHAWLVRAQLRLLNQAERVDLAETLRQAEDSLAVLQEAGDDLALTRAGNLLWLLYMCTGAAASQQEAGERAFEHAGRAGSRLDEAFTLALLGWSLVEGPTPVDEGMRIFDRLLEQLKGDPLGEATAASHLANLVAMQGRFDDARALISRSEAQIQEFGLGYLRTNLEVFGRARVETLAGDHEAAERAAQAGAERSAEIADNWFYVLASIDLARAVCDQGRPAECLCILEESERHPSPPDFEIAIKRSATRALALARLGQLEEADTVARDAVGHAGGTQFVGMHAGALLVLAEVLRLAGRPAEAATALAEALALYERKGNVVSAAKARVLLAELAA